MVFWSLLFAHHASPLIVGATRGRGFMKHDGWINPPARTFVPRPNSQLLCSIHYSLLIIHLYDDFSRREP